MTVTVKKTKPSKSQPAKAKQNREQSIPTMEYIYFMPTRKKTQARG